MSNGFGRFVILAGMRTGSNLLEATLNRIPGITCHGEAFNPVFVGWPENSRLLGMDLREREADPQAMLDRLFARPDHLSGFRYFHDHDPRVFDRIMADRDCAKIVLTRNPLESYVSTKLARQTAQWKLNPTETPIEDRTIFDAAEFRDALASGQVYLDRIRQALHQNGQSAFWLDYDDLRDAQVLTGLVHWLGRRDLDRVGPARDQMPQNPREMAEKVANLPEMQAELARLDPFGIGALRLFEAERGPAPRSYLATEAGRGLIFQPIPGGPVATIQQWLAELGQVQTGFTQGSLRQWKRMHPGHRSFAVLRHPLKRAWCAFRDLIDSAPPDLRQRLADSYALTLPRAGALLADAELVDGLHAFLRLMRRNLNGQTGLPTHPGWASQSAVVTGFSRLYPPDMLIREDDLSEDLALLAMKVGIAATLGTGDPDWPEVLNEPALIDAAHAAYLRDYIAFGFARSPFEKAP
jgi:hypothetical protein